MQPGLQPGLEEQEDNILYTACYLFSVFIQRSNDSLMAVSTEIVPSLFTVPILIYFFNSPFVRIYILI